MKAPLEFELVTLCARWNPPPANLRRFSELCVGDLDWNQVWELAIWHGLVPLLYRRLRSSPDNSCSTAILKDIQAHAAGIAIKNRLLLNYLFRVEGALAARGIEAISIKGPLLGVEIYGEEGLRPSSDLDLLVNRECAKEAVDILVELGFNPFRAELRDYLPELIQAGFEIPLVHSTGVALDLHWRLHMPGFRLSFDDFEEVWQRSAKASFRDQTVNTLGIEENLVYLAMHAARHEWGAIRWVADVAELLRSRECVEWERIRDYCVRLGIGRIWKTTLLLCADVLGLKLPDGESTGIRTDPDAVALSQDIARGWLEPSAVDSSPIKFPWRTHFYRSLESRRDRRKMVLDLLTRPWMEDWRFCRLPRVLWPLYVVLRPLRALTTRGGAAYRKFFEHSADANE